MVDEAASALRLAQESKPDELESLEREIMTLQIELESLKKETDVFSVERRNKVEADLLVKRQEADALTAVWKAGALSVLLKSPSFCLLSLQNVTAWKRSRKLSRGWKKLSTNSKSHSAKATLKLHLACVIPPYQN